MPNQDASSRRPSGLFANDASGPNRIATSILSLATSMPTSLLFCAILRLLPCSSGLEAHPTVRVKEDTTPVPRSTTGLCLGDLRAQGRRRAAVRAVARHHILHNRQTQGTCSSRQGCMSRSLCSTHSSAPVGMTEVSLNGRGRMSVQRQARCPASPGATRRSSDLGDAGDLGEIHHEALVGLEVGTTTRSR